MIRLVLVRHAQSTWNRDRRIQGQADPPLSPLGVRQASFLAEWLQETFPNAQLHSSDLQRCLETVAPLVANGSQPVTSHAGLRERDFGDWTGERTDEVESRWPSIHRRWRAGEDVLGEVAGETDVQVFERVRATFLEITADLTDGATAICFSHGGSIWLFLHAVLGIPLGRLATLGNTAVSQLVVGKGLSDPVLHGYNQVGHLPRDLITWFHPAEAGSQDSVEGERPRVSP